MKHICIGSVRLPARFVRGFSIFITMMALAACITLGIVRIQLTRMRASIAPLIEHEMERALGRDVQVGHVDIVGTTTVAVHDVAIAKGRTFDDGTALTIPLATARISIIAVLTEKTSQPVSAISRVVLHRPQLEISRSAQGRWDCQDVLDQLSAHQGASAFRASVSVRDGQMRYWDALGFTETPQAIRQHLMRVNARVIPHGASYVFTASAEDEHRRIGRVSIAGRFSQHAGGRMNVTANHVTVNAITQFLPKRLPVTFRDGTAAVRLSAIFSHTPAPDQARHMSATELTAEVDLTGVALKLDEMSTPLVATSGRLRLMHDVKRYPAGSRLSLQGIRAQAYNIPVTVNGDIKEINLFDLKHANPRLDIDLRMRTTDGARIARLFPNSDVTRTLRLDGPATLTAHVSGYQRNLDITGTVHSNGFVMHDLRGTGVQLSFRLRPTASKAPSAMLQARMRQGSIGSTRVRNFRIDAVSHTPFAKLMSRPVVSGTTSAGSVTLPWFDAGNVDANFTATDDGIVLSRVSGHAFAGSIMGSASFPFHTNTADQTAYALQADATYHHANLAKVAQALHIGDLHGTADGTLLLTIAPNGEVSVKTALASRDALYRDYHAKALSVALTATVHDGNTSIVINQGEAQTKYGTFTVTDGTYTRTGDTNELRLPLLGTALNFATFSEKIRGTGTLEGMVTGTSTQPVLTAKIHAVDGAILDRAFAEGTSDLFWRGPTLRLSQVVLSRPGISLRVLNESIDPRGDFVGLKATAELDKVALADALAYIPLTNPWPVDGPTSGIVDLSYTDHGIVAAGSAAIPKATVHIPREQDHAYTLALDRLAFDFSYADRQLQIRDLALTRGSSVVHTTGTGDSTTDLGMNLDLVYTGEQVHLEEMPLDLVGVPVPLAGATTLRGTVRGYLGGNGPEPLRVTVKSTSPDMRISGVPAGRGAIDLTYAYRPQDRVLDIRTGTIEHPAYHISTHGQYSLTGKRMTNVVFDMDHLDLAAVQHTLQTMPPVSPQALMARFAAMKLPAGLRGQGALRLTADGTFETPDVTASVRATKLGMGTQDLPDIRVELASALYHGKYGVRINDFSVYGTRGEGQVALAGAIFPDGTLDLTYNIRDLDPTLLAQYLGNVPVEGKMQIHGRATGPWTRPALSADVTVPKAQVANMTVGPVNGHLQLAGEQLVISDGSVRVSSDMPPIGVVGKIPVRWTGPLPNIAMDRAMTITISLPRQQLASLKLTVPGIRSLRGIVTGEVHIGGTVKTPKLSGGAVRLTGGADLAQVPAGLPQRLDDVDARIRIVNADGSARLMVEHLSAVLGGVRQPGAITGGGEISIPVDALRTPEHWKWNLQVAVAQMPLPKEITMVSQASGYLHLEGTGRSPVLHGVVMVDNATIKQTSISKASRVPQWGPFPINPRLSLVLHVGEKVKFKTSLATVTLLPTPLARPALPSSAQTSGDEAAYHYSADMLKPESPHESAGTWAVVTGSLNDPHLYARFEVDGKKLSFPLSLIGSLKHAKGHLTYNLRDGAQLVMGLDKIVEMSSTEK